MLTELQYIIKINLFTLCWFGLTLDGYYGTKQAILAEENNRKDNPLTTV